MSCFNIPDFPSDAESGSGNSSGLSSYVEPISKEVGFDMSLNKEGFYD